MKRSRFVAKSDTSQYGGCKYSKFEHKHFEGEHYDKWLHHLVNRDAIYLRDRVLQRENVYGYAHDSCPRTSQPFYRFLLTEKEKFPKDLLLVQHGEFFNLWGIDAIFGIEFGGLTVHRKKTPDREKTMRCSTQRVGVQKLLDRLVAQCFSIRVYEQTGDRSEKNSGRHTGPILRECTQLVNQAVPYFYPNSSCLDSELGGCHAPVLFVYPDAILRIDVINHSYRTFTNLGPTSLRCALDSFCQCTPYPICFASVETIRLYRLRDCEVFDDTLDYRACVDRTATRYSYDPVVFTEEEKGGPFPLLHCTLVNLGLHTGGPCDFVEQVAGPQVRPLERAFLRRWLSYPRSTAARSLMEECVADIHSGVHVVDTSTPLNPHSVLHRLVNIAQNPHPDVHRGRQHPHFLVQLLTHLEKRRDHAAIIEVTCWDIGVHLPFATYQAEVVALEGELRTHLFLEDPPPVPGFPTEATCRNEVYLAPSPAIEAVTAAKHRFAEILAGRPYLHIGPGESGLVSIEGDDGLSMYRCPELDEAYQEYIASCLTAREDQHRMISDLGTRLYRTYRSALRVFLSSQITAQAIHRHLQHVAPQRWQRALVGGDKETTVVSSYGFEGLFPVWSNPATYSVNNVQLSPGRLVLLTAPNASGKTTLLRAVTGALLLANAGLLCPCSSARVPEVDSIVLKVGSADNHPDRHLSSFEAEMHDMNLILQTSTQRSFVALDEIGRATSYPEGLAVTQALVERLQAQTGYLFVSTHMYELLDEFQCAQRQTLLSGYRYQEGETRDSGSLAVCTRFAIDPSVVERARSLLLQRGPSSLGATNVRDVGVPEKVSVLSIASEVIGSEPNFVPLGTLPPPCVSEKCCVYVIKEGNQDLWYIGETKNVALRQLQHRSRGREGHMWVYRVQNKSLAMQYETLIIRECISRRIRLSSVKDSLHSI